VAVRENELWLGMEYRHTTPLSYGDWGVSVVGLILLSPWFGAAWWLQPAVCVA